MTATAALLECKGLHAGYGRKEVLHDVGLAVAGREILTVLGHNGAGKSTLLRTLFGVHTATRGIAATGAGDPRVAAESGYLTLVPAERFVFPALSIAENLAIACPRPARARFDERLATVHQHFPMLAARPGLRAGALSGGQQRMLSLGMALMRGPRVLLLDEPSLGLAPAIQEQLFDTVRALSDDAGIGVVLVEQNVVQALRVADRVLILHSGRVSHTGPAAELRDSDRSQWWEMF